MGTTRPGGSLNLRKDLCFRKTLNNILIHMGQIMKNINTHKWSTPAIIGSGIFVSVSGVLMFLGVHNPLEMAHEWIGLVVDA